MGQSSPKLAKAIDLPPGIPGDWKFKAICSVGGKAVAAPCHVEKILMVDPSTSTASDRGGEGRGGEGLQCEVQYSFFLRGKLVFGAGAHRR